MDSKIREPLFRKYPRASQSEIVPCSQPDGGASPGPLQRLSVNRDSKLVCVTFVLRCACLCVCCLPSVWTQESTCHLIETNIKDHDELEGKKVPQYPCLWVNVSAVGRWAVLYHTEDTRDQNQQVMNGGCELVPGCPCH